MGPNLKLLTDLLKISANKTKTFEVPTGPRESLGSLSGPNTGEDIGQ